MTITAADINDILAFLATHPEYQERFRPLVVGKDLQGVPGRLDRIEAILETVGVRLDALAKQTAALTERMDGLTVRMDALTRAVELLTMEVRAQGKRQDRMDGRLGNLEGRELEHRYRANVGNWFGEFIQDPQHVQVPQLPRLQEAVDRGEITPAELSHVRRLDLIISGRDWETSESFLLAAEISYKVFKQDIDRAVSRALTLRRSGYDARPFVGGYEIDDAASEAANANGVIVDIHQQ